MRKEAGGPHKYLRLRDEPYVATLTVTGDSQAGAVEASSAVNVVVVEGKGWVIGGYNLKGNTRDAVRLFSVLIREVVTAGIWVVIFSPLWGGLLARRVRTESPIRPLASEARTS